MFCLLLPDCAVKPEEYDPRWIGRSFVEFDHPELGALRIPVNIHSGERGIYVTRSFNVYMGSLLKTTVYWHYQSQLDKHICPLCQAEKLPVDWTDIEKIDCPRCVTGHLPLSLANVWSHFFGGSLTDQLLQKGAAQMDEIAAWLLQGLDDGRITEVRLGARDAVASQPLQWCNLTEVLTGSNPQSLGKIIKQAGRWQQESLQIRLSNRRFNDLNFLQQPATAQLQQQLGHWPASALLTSLSPQALHTREIERGFVAKFSTRGIQVQVGV